jgi:signal transduction histidine kinase
VSTVATAFEDNSHIGAKDVALAAAIAAVATIGVWQEITHSPWKTPPTVLAYCLGIAAGAVIVFRRRYPLAVALGCLAMVAIYHLSGFPGAAPAMATFGAVAFVAYQDRTGWLWLAIVIGVATAVVVALPPHSVDLSNGAVYGPAFGFITAAFLGETMRRRNNDMAARLAQVDARSREEASSRMVQERIRIARDLHDIVAHTVAVINVQAAVADESLDTRPADAHAALQIIRQAAKAATQELQSTVGLLRTGEEVDDVRAPTPGLEHLEELIRRLPSLEVGIFISGEPRPLSRSVDLTAYRIVQESLTNVSRHAGCGVATVEMVYLAEGLTLRIGDTGCGASGNKSDGFGLVGMRERAKSVGGSVVAGPRDGGGFQVTASLPYGAMT